MGPVQVTLTIPGELWNAVQCLAADEGDANTVILRVVEEYVTTAAKKHDSESGKYRDLVQALSTPVADLHLSARPASALQMLHIRYIYELVQQSPMDRFTLPNVGDKSLKEIKEKLAALGLTLGMTLEDDAYRVAVVAAVASSMQTPQG